MLASVYLLHCINSCCSWKEEIKLVSFSADDCPFLADVRMDEALFYSPYLNLVQIPVDYEEVS